jgi:hypothetical protein
VLYGYVESALLWYTLFHATLKNWVLSSTPTTLALPTA